jgi:hypothetical protein
MQRVRNDAYVAPAREIQYEESAGNLVTSTGEGLWEPPRSSVHWHFVFESAGFIRG